MFEIRLLALVSAGAFALTTGAIAQNQPPAPEDVPFCREDITASLCRDESGEVGEYIIIAHTPRLLPVQVWGDRTPDDPGSFSGLYTFDVVTAAADHPAEILNTLPGVNIQMNSGQEHLIAIRSPVLTGGAGQGSFLILENGVPTRSPAFGNVNGLFELHHETAEAIEVVRGPGSAKYGSNAVHGLINVILAEPGESGNELRLSGSSIGRYRGDLILENRDNVAASLSIQKDNGWRDNSGSIQTKASAITEFQLGQWEATAWVSGANLEQETAGFLRGPDAYLDRDLAKTNPNPEAYRDAWSLRAAVRLERDLGEGTLTLTPFARTQAMDFRQHFLPYRGLEKNRHSAIGLMSRYRRELSDALTWRIGGDIDLATGELTETQPEPFGFFPGDTRFPVGIHYDYSVDTTVGAVWSELDWSPTPKLKILAGLRGEAHAYDYTTAIPAGTNGRFNVPADRSDNFDFVTPKLGLIWDASDDIALYANYARGARAPQASDLYRLQSQQGIAEAGIETLDSLEIGARGAALNGDLVFDIAAYWMDKDNFFFRDSDGLNVTDGSTRHQGIESAFDWTLADQWALRGTVAWSDQTYTFDRPVGSSSNSITDGDQIDTAPEWLAGLSLVWTPTDKFEAALSAEYVGEYFTDPANTNDYPGHTVAHLRGSYALTDTISAYIIARNLFDEAYADRADFAFGSERYFPGEPLNVTFGIRKRFE